MKFFYNIKSSVCSKLLLLCFLQVHLFAQTVTTRSVKTNIENYGTNFQQERIYIQFDKPVYAPGETIWFKAYIMQGINTSDISKNFYFDFTDSGGNVLLHSISPVIQSSAKGGFEIPAAYTGQTIHITAYTKWMLNFDSAFLYNKDIFVIQKKPAAMNAVKKTGAVIHFFPESGDCISGINGKIAFKANYENGLPANVNGNVVNSKGETVATLASMHDGMGFFYLEPQAGETYNAKWKDDKAVLYQSNLPVVKNNGAALEIKPATGQTGFVIRRSINAAGNFTEMHIVATMQQQLVYMASVKLDASPVVSGSIPTAQLPSGILQITLFDSNWIAVAERICFVNNNDFYFEPEVGFSALGLEKRRENILVISLPDSVEANLSVAITDAGVGVDSSDDIISHFLITGDLKGSVYHPSYYFSNSSDSTAQHLDLVMLTNGWRRIKWEDVVQGKMPKIKYPNDTAYLSFGGKVYGASPDELRGSSNLLIILKAKDSSQQNMIVPVNPDGSFEQSNVILFDTLKAFYQFAGVTNLNNSAEVTFGNGSVPSPKKISINRDNFKNFYIDTAAENRAKYFADEEARLAQLLKTTTLQDVVVKTKAKSPLQLLDEKYAGGLFSGGDAAQFDLTNDPVAKSTFSIFTYLQGRVAGLTINSASSSGGTPSLTWRGSTPEIYIDEIQSDVSTANSLTMNDIAYIKVFRPPFMGAFGGGSGGAIAVYTKKGGDASSRPSKGLAYKIVTGYTPQKEFYSPDYGTIDQRNEQQDYRSTIYWNPLVITTSANHIIRLPFYNNDITNSFRVIVEGVSKDGRLTRIEKVIE